MRYFKTVYITPTLEKLLIHNNDQDKLPDREWVIQSIKDLNTEEIITVSDSVEISKEEYDRLLEELPDA